MAMYLTRTWPSLPWPGTTDFDQLKQEFIDKPITEGGSRVVDKSKMWHIEGLYNFSRQVKIFDLLVGMSHRIFFLNTEGTIFIDEPGEPIRINQFGAFAQIVKRCLMIVSPSQDQPDTTKMNISKDNLHPDFPAFLQWITRRSTISGLHGRPHTGFRQPRTNGLISMSASSGQSVVSRPSIRRTISTPIRLIRFQEQIPSTIRRS